MEGSPHTPPAKRPSPPGFELPKVLQSDCNNLCLRASHRQIYQQLQQHQMEQQQQQQQQSSPIMRPRTSPSMPTNTPPLMVRSLHVLPRPQAARLLHSTSLLKMPLRQRPVTACDRVRGRNFSTINCSPTYYSPTLAISPGVSRKGFAAAFDCQGSEENVAVANCMMTTPVKCQDEMDEENGSNSSNMWCSTTSSTPTEKEQSPSLQSPEGERVRSKSEKSSPPEQQRSNSLGALALLNSSDGADQINSNIREQPMASSIDDYYKDLATKRPSCRRNLAKELERELTFKPELNQRSLKIASRSTRQNVPLLCRLTERRKKYANGNGYSFMPKINPHSVKLAQERAEKIQEVCLVIVIE